MCQLAISFKHKILLIEQFLFSVVFLVAVEAQAANNAMF